MGASSKGRGLLFLGILVIAGMLLGKERSLKVVNTALTRVRINVPDLISPATSAQPIWSSRHVGGVSLHAPCDLKLVEVMSPSAKERQIWSHCEAYAGESSSCRIVLKHYSTSIPHDPTSLGRYAQSVAVYNRGAKEPQTITGQVATAPTNRFVAGNIAKEAQISHLDNNEQWICRNVAFMKNRELWICGVFHKPANQSADVVFEKVAASIRPD